LRINSYASTGQAIQAPFTFYYVRDNDWSDSHSYQFWNKNFTTAVGANNEVTLKTIYSPSPSGYVEPKTAAFTGFTSTGGNTHNSSQYNISGNYNRGWNFYTNGWKTGNTFFFAAIGFRDVYSGRSGTGAVDFDGEDGSFWEVGASSISNGCVLNIGSGYVSPHNGNARSFGYFCWAVRE